MKHRSVIRFLGAIAAVCAPLTLSSAAAGGAPAVKLDKVGDTVGESVARAGASLPQVQTTPVTRAPATKPSPAPAAPRPAGASAQSPARVATPAAPVRATGSKAGASAAPSAPTARSSAAAPAKASGGAKAADPTDAVQADSGSGQTAAVSSVGDADAGSLPFTGSTILPVFLVAVLLLLAGVVLRRAVRLRT